MKTVTVSESALDSIKAMGEADAARIAKLEAALRRLIACYAVSHPPEHRRDAWDQAKDALK